MDVDRLSFYPLLVDILTDISTAHFVSIDLELSGIPTRDSYSDAVGKPSLQQRYLETKEAAQRYQILQIGLTCVEQDVLTDKYVLRPYNFDLCPVIQEQRLKIERIFSFQSGAAEFLLREGFDMDHVFRSGVPYLSRSESKHARREHERGQDKAAVADIQIKPTEVESMAFLERVRREIDAWVASRDEDALHYLELLPTQANSDAGSTDATPPELSRFEKRLVHQLVRAEYPKLVSLPKRTYIQIIEFDKDREDRIAQERKQELEERISRQKGFRWIIEALHGSNISSLNLRECAKDSVTGAYIAVDLQHLKGDFHRAQCKLRHNPKIIVGHNCFLDMVYIYHTFIGELPNTVEEFSEKLHSFWPIIVDTKYMSTHNCGDISPASSLEQIATQLKNQQMPVVETHPGHSKYVGTEAYHEAGFDSFLTAQIAVRLSAKLGRELPQLGGKAPTLNDLSNGVGAMTLASDGLWSPDSATSFSSSSQLGPNGSAAENPTISNSTGFVPSVHNIRWKKAGDPSVVAPEDAWIYTERNKPHRQQVPEQTIPGGMPRFTSDFWRVYGNKLRVFGTEEGVCVLDPSKADSSEEEGGVTLR